MKYLYYCTRRNVYKVTRNEDGTVTLYPDVKNAGGIIMQQGGIQGFLAHCVEDDRDYDAFLKDFDLIMKKQDECRIEMRKRNAIKRADAAINGYKALLAKYGIDPACPEKGGVIEATAVNLRILMRYLQSVNCGLWRLPRLSQGYAAHQHDCGGKTAVTVFLDEGIESDGKIYKKLQYGAPTGFLNQYAPVGRL